MGLLSLTKKSIIAHLTHFGLLKPLYNLFCCCILTSVQKRVHLADSAAE